MTVTATKPATVEFTIPPFPVPPTGFGGPFVNLEWEKRYSGHERCKYHTHASIRIELWLLDFFWLTATCEKTEDDGSSTEMACEWKPGEKSWSEWK